MKRIAALFISALFAANCFATTYAPISLLDPAGSISGQFITSTGPSTPMAWSTVTLAGLGGLSTVTAASTYGAKASSLSQFAATTSAQLASVISDETGSGSLVFGTSPTVTTPNIIGVANGSNAAAGSVGEVKYAPFSAVAITNSATPQNLVTLSLPAGDWDIQANALFSTTSVGPQTAQVLGLNTTSITLPAAGQYAQSAVSVANGGAQSLIAPVTHVNPSTTATVFLVGESVFSAGTVTASGFIYARRVSR